MDPIRVEVSDVVVVITGEVGYYLEPKEWMFV